MNANKTQIHIDFYACNSKFLNDLPTRKHSSSKRGFKPYLTMNYKLDCFFIANIVFFLDNQQELKPHYKNRVMGGCSEAS